MIKFYIKYHLVLQFLLLQLLLFCCIYFVLEGNDLFLFLSRISYTFNLFSFVDKLVYEDIIVNEEKI